MISVKNLSFTYPGNTVSTIHDMSFSIDAGEIFGFLGPSGSGKSIINDSASTVQTLKKIGDLLVDMHGPHDHQSLLSSNFQTDILDAHGSLIKQRGKTRFQ